MSTFTIANHQTRPLSMPDGARLRSGWQPIGYYLGGGTRTQLEVAVVTAPTRPSETDVRALWKKRRGNTPSPLLLIVQWPLAAGHRVSVCGTSGDEPPVYSDREPAQIARLAGAALSEPDHHAAVRLLGLYLSEDAGGLRNAGLFATHHLKERVPLRPDWKDLCRKGADLLGLRRHQLIEALGFTVEPRGQGAVLRAGGTAAALAVFLEDSESADTQATRFAGITPVSWAMAAASADNIPYVMVARGPQLRVYTTASGAGLGGKGGTGAFVEVNLTLLTEADAGYLPLLCSAASLGSDGLFAELLAESNDFAIDLGSRLRDRVYGYAVPAIAEALIAHHDGDTDVAALSALYNQALLVLFRLMFVAYAEDRDLLPLRSNGLYRQRSLKHAARELADLANEHGWDAVPFDENASDLWANVQALWTAVDKGRREWSVPAYNGGMFATDPDVNDDGAALAQLSLTNAEIGPGLLGLLVDELDDHTFAPVDFASLDVREFGTIYEGLLESNLAVAPCDLTVNSDDAWVPASSRDDVYVSEGDVYLHNKSGARKASGSYFTKPFAVNHLLDQALEPAIGAHLSRVEALLDAGDDVGASDAFFDFRVADLAMGSGHFLVAAVDRIGRAFATFLVERRIPGVLEELDRLAAAADANMREAGVTVDGIDTEALLRRQIARRCIYGVDLNPVSVDLARMALWVHTFVRGLPLTSLNHGLVEGNALTGIGTVDEVARILDPTSKTGTASFLEDALTDALGEATEALARFAATSEATAAEVKAARAAHAAAATATAPIGRLFDLAVGTRLGLTQPTVAFEVGPLLAEAETFDASVLADLKPLHFPAAFPEVFSRDRPGFDCILGNPPWQEATLEVTGFWARHFPGLKALPAAQQGSEIERLRRERPDLSAEYDAEAAEQEAARHALMRGPFPGMGTGDPDTYKGFIWRFATLTRTDGLYGVVLPRSALAAAGSAEWRRDVLDNNEFVDLCLLLNKARWVFDEVHPQYTIGLCTIRVGASHAGTVHLRGPYSSRNAYDDGVAKATWSTVTAADLEGWTENASVPLVPSEAAMRVFLRLREHPRFDSGVGWRARPVAELHATNDKNQMLMNDEPDGTTTWPVYKGESFDIWKPDTGSYYAAAPAIEIQAFLQSRRLRQQRTSSSAFSAFSREWALDPSTLPCLHPRIAFRDISRATDTRTVRAALLPPHVVITNKGPYLLWSKGDIVDQAFVLGVLSSIPLDWYARRVVELGLNFHIFNAFPVPRPPAESSLRARVANIAGRLAAVDERFADWADELGVGVGSIGSAGEQAVLEAELDAAVALLYGLDAEDTRVVFETFHEGWDYAPRLAAVLKHMDRLASETR